MATLLLIVIYIAFIGLGVPDSIFGVAWPAMYQDFGLPVASAGFVTIPLSCGTILSSLFSARVIGRFGTAKTTALSTCLTAAALLGFSFAHSFWWLTLLAVPLGLGAGSIDTALNHYVAVHYKASHMNFLHCFYGVGVSISPYLMSLALAGTDDWRAGCRLSFYVQLAIALVTVVSLPLWKRAHGDAGARQAAQGRKAHGLRRLAALPQARLVWLVFIGSCGIECTCGVWGGTYLVSAKGMSADRAAQAVMFYYIGIALGRLGAGLLSKKLSSWRLIHIGQAVVLAAIALLALPPVSCAWAGLFLIGLGNGPLFPNLVHLTPKNFGEDAAQSVMGTQMAAAYLGITLLPPLFGLLAQRAGAGVLPWYLLCLFAAMAAATRLLIRTLRRIGRYP